MQRRDRWTAGDQRSGGESGATVQGAKQEKVGGRHHGSEGGAWCLEFCGTGNGGVVFERKGRSDGGRRFGGQGRGAGDRSAGAWVSCSGAWLHWGVWGSDEPG